MKKEQLKKSKEEKKCFINQHDFQQIKSYKNQMKLFSQNQIFPVNNLQYFPKSFKKFL